MEKSGKFYRFPRTFFKIATTEFKTNKIIVFKLRVLYSKYAELKDLSLLLEMKDWRTLFCFKAYFIGF